MSKIVGGIKTLTPAMVPVSTINATVVGMDKIKKHIFSLGEVDVRV